MCAIYSPVDWKHQGHKLGFIFNSFQSQRFFFSIHLKLSVINYASLKCYDAAEEEERRSGGVPADILRQKIVTFSRVVALIKSYLSPATALMEQPVTTFVTPLPHAHAHTHRCFRTLFLGAFEVQRLISGRMQTARRQTQAAALPPDWRVQCGVCNASKSFT